MSSENSKEVDYLGGDPVAFGELVTRYQHSLFGFLGRMGLEPAVCEELAQETFLRAWVNRASYDAGKAAVSTWLFTIARNLALSHLSKKTVPVAEETEIEHRADPSADPSSQFEQHESIGRLRRALNTLSSDDRDVIATCYTPEIENTSDVLGCSPGALRTRLSRARQRLSEALVKLDKEL